jgi:hypothetical protein
MPATARYRPQQQARVGVPSEVVVALILLGESSVRAATGQRFRTMFRVAIPFGCGLVSPIIVFLLPYARAGEVWKFLFGVTSSAISRSVDLGVIPGRNRENHVCSAAGGSAGSGNVLG